MSPQGCVYLLEVVFPLGLTREGILDYEDALRGAKGVRTLQRLARGRYRLVATRFGYRLRLREAGSEAGADRPLCLGHGRTLELLSRGALRKR